MFRFRGILNVSHNTIVFPVRNEQNRDKYANFRTLYDDIIVYGGI